MNTRFVVVAVALIAYASAPLQAQASRKASTADSLQVSAAIYAQLFQGITLTAERKATAEAAIRRTFTEQHRLLPVATQRAWEKLNAIQAHRDSILLTLVAAKDTAVLRTRLAANRPKSARWK